VATVTGDPGWNIDGKHPVSTASETAVSEFIYAASVIQRSTPKIPSDDHRVPGAIHLGGSLEVMSKLEAVGYRLEVAGGFG
jgi:hypothetical protein